MRIFLIHLFLWFGSICWVIAQENPSIKKLEEVSVWASPYQKYASGSKTQVIDSLILAFNSTETIGKTLERYSPIYFKEYGNGMLSTVAFRGTGASHTAVLWNGININSLSLGQLDFNVIPSVLMDNVSLQYGASSTLYGTDAVGGAVLLEGLSFEKIPKSRFELLQSFGSFGKVFTAGKIYLGGEKWRSVTKVYRSFIENNFEFRNIAKQGFPIETQENASVLQQGIIQEFHFKPTNLSILALRAWYQEADRNIQPLMNNLEANDKQQDRSLRLLLDFQQYFKNHFFYSKISYTDDYLKFNEFAPSRIKRGVLNTGIELDFGQKWQVHSGINAQYIRALMEENYGRIISENRFDAFLFLKYQLFSDWQITLNFRQSWVAEREVPFNPTLGLEGILWKNQKQQVLLKANIGRHFRIPTLNDRYWNPGGNPELKSEAGYSTEIGLHHIFQNKNWLLRTSATAYRMEVQNWILWQPTGSFWSPFNIQEVLSQGIEGSFFTQFRQQEWLWELGGNYTFSQAIQQKKKSQFDRSQGKQLPYTPLHNANLFQTFQYKTWRLGVDANFTGARYLNADNSDFLKSYWLWQISLSKNLTWKKMQFQTQFKVNNLTNVEYQNLAFRAMPLRNYEMILQLNF